MFPNGIKNKIKCLTCFAKSSFKSRKTVAFKRVEFVHAGGTILTRVTLAFIEICHKKQNTFYLHMWNAIYSYKKYAKRSKALSLYKHLNMIIVNDGYSLQPREELDEI